MGICPITVGAVVLLLAALVLLAATGIALSLFAGGFAVPSAVFGVGSAWSSSATAASMWKNSWPPGVFESIP